MKTKVIMRCFQSPGDVVMLTAAVRDLHRRYPEAYLTDVRSSCPALWDNNPYLTPLAEEDPDVRSIDCHYPLVHRSNQQPYHFIHGYMQDLSEQLDLDIRPTEFRGDMHLSPEEKTAPSTIVSEVSRGLPLWIVVAGGKYDFTIKWWNWRRYQRVIDTLADRVRFIQVGEEGHYHPPLKNVCDLRGKTSLRDLIRLVYLSDGILCGVTLLMHLAAAVPLRPGQPSRPAVIIAGGRESPHWESYPTHQFLHAVGMLRCCAQGGCWKARTVPLGDGDPKDHPDHLCVDVVRGLPRCMDMISVQTVTNAVADLASFQNTHGVRRTVDAEQAGPLRPWDVPTQTTTKPKTDSLQTCPSYE